MSVDMRTIDLQNLPDVIRLMNESSKGMSFEWNLDLISFLAILRYWDFSYEHSLIGYIEGEPAALILNSTSPEHHDAYTVYWGTLPKFRTRRISMNLFNESCKKLLDDGYFILHGVSVPDRPVRRYRFIQAQPGYNMVDMQTDSPKLPASDSNIEVRKIDLDVLRQLPLPTGECLHWCQRHSFLRNTAPFLLFLGAFAGDSLKAYAVAFPHARNTSLVDLRSCESDLSPGYELLRWLFERNYRPPFDATYVFEQSYAHRVLASAGFSVKRQFSTLTRDLRVTTEATSIPA